jgi:hypothetical protein
VTFDWQKVAKKIVDDVANRQAFDDSTPTVFEAEAKLRVSLSRFAQKI